MTEPYSAIARAGLLMQSHRAAEAVVVLREGLADAPENVQLLCALSEAHTTLQQWPEAILSAEAAVQRAPDSSPALCRLCAANLGAGRIRIARAAGRAAMRLDPHSVATLSTVFLVALRRRDRRQMSSLANRMLAINPADAMVQNDAGLACEARFQLRRAEGHFREALRIDPTYGPALANLGNLLGRLGRRTEALEVLRTAAEGDVRSQKAMARLRSQAAVPLVHTASLDSGLWILDLATYPVRLLTGVIRRDTRRVPRGMRGDVRRQRLVTLLLFVAIATLTVVYAIPTYSALLPRFPGETWEIYLLPLLAAASTFVLPVYLYLVVRKRRRIRKRLSAAAQSSGVGAQAQK
jgi:Flp pilus assembly protein TadD